MKLRDFARFARKGGCYIDLKKGKGSHAAFERPGMRTYFVPASNGMNTELSDRYLKKACSQLGLDVSQLPIKQSSKKKGE
jgi:hypothetical protein